LQTNKFSLKTPFTK